MLTNLTHMSITPLEFILRAVVVYFAVLVLLRISGKREMGQMSALEFVAVLLISNAVQNSMNGGDNSLVGGLILASTLIFVSWIISLLTYKNKKISYLFEGTPRVLVLHSKIIEKNLKKERMTENDLMVMLRKQGFHHLTELSTAILEADGHLSVFRPEEAPKLPTI